MVVIITGARRKSGDIYRLEKSAQGGGQGGWIHGPAKHENFFLLTRETGVCISFEPGDIIVSLGNDHKLNRMFIIVTIMTRILKP